MKTLFLAVLFIVAKVDTPVNKRPDVALYNKIETKAKEIQRKTYTTDDVYSLLLKQNRTLNQSLSLNKREIKKNDSISAALHETRGYLQTILRQQTDQQVIYSEKEKEYVQYQFVNSLMDRTIMIPFWIIILSLSICYFLVYKYDLKLKT